MTVDERVAQALLTEFNENQIYHDTLPERGVYPMIQYTDLSCTPVLHTDNKLYGYENIVRVTVVSNMNAGLNALKDLVYHAMVSAGFMWQNTSKNKDGKEYYVSLDFSIGGLTNE